MTVALIYGGKSGEHEVSLMSASAIARNIGRKYDVVLIAITKDGRWFLQSEDELKRIRNDDAAVFKIFEDEKNAVQILPGEESASFKTTTKNLHIDVAFPILHGTYGEDGTVQGLLEMASLAYVGCSVEASAITMDKEKTKILLDSAGIPVVPSVCVRRSDLSDSRKYDELVEKAIDLLGFPIFVKPSSAGSSDGASKAKNAKELSFAIMEAFEWDDKILLEKAVAARELECAVTGNTLSATDNNAEQLVVYGPGEIVLTHEFYDYNAKYNDSDSVQIPANIPDNLRNEIRELAKKAYMAVDATGLSRVDFFLDKDTGDLYINEINAMPGFTAISMFPKLCESEGLSFATLIDRLIDEALLRYRARSTLRTSR